LLGKVNLFTGIKRETVSTPPLIIALFGGKVKEGGAWPFPCFRWLDYSLSIPVIVIVIVALAEELLDLLTLLATSSLGTLVSATEMSVSLKPSRPNPTRRIARVTTVTNLFTSTLS